jgi:hypothetical protein
VCFLKGFFFLLLLWVREFKSTYFLGLLAIASGRCRLLWIMFLLCRVVLINLLLSKKNLLISCVYQIVVWKEFIDCTISTCLAHLGMISRSSVKLSAETWFIILLLCRCMQMCTYYCRLLCGWCDAPFECQLPLSFLLSITCIFEVRRKLSCFLVNNWSL